MQSVFTSVMVGREGFIEQWSRDTAEFVSISAVEFGKSVFPGLRGHSHTPGGLLCRVLPAGATSVNRTVWSRWDIAF